MKDTTFHAQGQSDQPYAPRKKSSSGSALADYTIEQRDVNHTVRINDGPTIHFLTKEYLLFMLLWEQRKQGYVSYRKIAQYVWECELDDEMLCTIRRRVSDIRGKVARYGLDIINISHRGYKVGLLNNVVVPYRRGERARKTPR